MGGFMGFVTAADVAVETPHGDAALNEEGGEEIKELSGYGWVTAPEFRLTRDDDLEYEAGPLRGWDWFNPWFSRLKVISSIVGNFDAAFSAVS